MLIIMTEASAAAQINSDIYDLVILTVTLSITMSSKYLNDNSASTN